MPDISILTPDGQTKVVALDSQRVGLGRANTNELCYPEDSGLSRQHLYFERQGEDWYLTDPGSKNGTLLNGDRIEGSRRLKPGDRVNAGHLTIVYGAPAKPFNETVVFIDTREEKATLSRQLNELLPSRTTGLDQASLSADRIGALVKAGRELAGHRPLNELFPLILNLAIEGVQAERGVLMVTEGDELVAKASSGGNNFRISSGVRDRVLRDKTSILVNDVMSDEAFRGMQSLVQQQVRMLIAVPLQTTDKAIGLIYVDSPSLKHEFTADDLNLLTVMANVAAIRIEHARLAEVEQAEKILAKDLEQAAIIQRGLLPQDAPTIAGLDMAGYNAACRTVGGDYYEYLRFPDGRFGVALGDVSGKAMPAALLMTSLHARVGVLAETATDVADMLTRLNRHTSANCPSNRFITFFIAMIDPQTGAMSYANAGHNPPMIVRASGEEELLNGGGLIMGLFPGAKYEAYPAHLNPGDAFVLFSDGVTEATNAANEEYGEERLSAVLRRSTGKSAAEIAEAITKDVAAFVAGAPANDDLTFLVVKKTV